MNKILLVAAIIGLIAFPSIAHGQVSDRPNPLRELMNNGVVTADNAYHVFLPPTAELIQLVNTIDKINIILDHCYQHADNANPVQELVGKGLVSSEFSSDSCGSIKQKHDNVILVVLNIENQIREKGCYGEGCVPDYRLK